MEIRNAKIEDTMLGIEDHGCFTFWLHLSWDSASQAFGGWAMGDASGHYDSTTMIKRVLKIVGVDKWEDLKGKFIRIDSEHFKINGIGNLLKDEWFYPEKEYKNIKVE